MIKNIKNNSLISNSKVGVSFVSGPPAVKTIKIPIIPKMIDENIKTFVAIFCMV
jgi:hypothetical protein